MLLSKNQHLDVVLFTIILKKIQNALLPMACVAANNVNCETILICRWSFLLIDNKKPPFASSSKNVWRFMLLSVFLYIFLFYILQAWMFLWVPNQQVWGLEGETNMRNRRIHTVDPKTQQYLQLLPFGNAQLLIYEQVCKALEAWRWKVWGIAGIIRLQKSLFMLPWNIMQPFWHSAPVKPVRNLNHCPTVSSKT